MKNEVNYNIALDIGVGSVGWSVTDEENNILKRNGKNMWGARLFKEANTAKETRIYRTSRRRLDRRKERINILQSLMQDDIEKQYPNFLPMLRETDLKYEDKVISKSISGVKYNLFSEEKITDSTYYKRFPTIYHLREYLINTNKKEDIRLVYLAIHHIIKYRGNFLYEGNFSNDTSLVNEYLQYILDYLKDNYEILLNSSKDQIIELLKDRRISKAEKKDKLICYFDYEKEDKQILVNIINAILGYSFDINRIFETGIKTNKLTFASEIENEEEIKSELQKNAEIYEYMKSMYSWYILQDILNGKTYISEAFKEKYDKYKKDLELLKNIYKKYFKNEYNSMFKENGENNYVAYNGKSQGKTFKKCKPEDFFNKLKKKIETLPDECEEKEKIKKELDENNFLKKINVIDNSAIPYQLHEKELIRILENQSKYYKTLEENRENIIKLFEFRIPYYVGPLSKGEGRFSWAVRNSNEKVRPWNFEQVIDIDATAEKFIKRMTNKCTYLLSENVIPKQSLLYSKFCVLNELNNIRKDNYHLSRNEKKEIIEKIFKKKKKVTSKDLKDYFRLEGEHVKTITGLTDDNNFTSNMASYIDMEKIFGKIDDSQLEKIENIIYWITIFEDKKVLKNKIKKEYEDVTEEQINKLAKLRYTGWSRLSKKLIAGLKAYDGDTIIEKLEKTQMNFMQIINEDKFGFNKQLEELMPKQTNKITYNDVAEIPTSPANKRAIWQTICVVKEIIKIMKKQPKNIYIEFARSEEAKIMKDNRAKQLLKKYEEIRKELKELKDNDDKVYKELKQHQNDKTLTDKMYLYFVQNGKCLYSGKTLNIDELSKYEVDHILPQSYIKDDSLDNKALVIKEENQRKKDSLLLADNIIDSRIEWWTSLLNAGLISQKKYSRLIRRKIFETDNEKEKFINRQLVETRQITKYVTNLLVNEYKTTNVFALRAHLTHEFRDKYKIYKNRNVNNFHHAQDAYILSVIGNTLDAKWHGLEKFKYSEYMKNDFKEEKHGMIIGFVSNNIDIKKIKKILNYKDYYISRMLQEETGTFYNQTLYSPSDKKNKPVINLKNNRPAEKYGGYSGENKSFYTIFGYTYEGKEEYQLKGIPIKIAYEIKSGKESLEDYIKNEFLVNKKYTNFRIIRKKILKNQEYLDENHELMRFCSDREVRPSKELIVNKKMAEMIYLINIDENKLTDKDKEKIDYEYMFDYLINKLNKEYKCLKNASIKISTNRDLFLKLNINEKNSVINKIIDMIESRYVNLKELKLSSSEGRMKDKNFNTEKLLSMTFIDKSVTGMYERRYRVNGMENSSSK